MSARLLLLALLPTLAAAQPSAPGPATPEGRSAAAVMGALGPAVARVHCRGNAGVGVVFADRRHLLTARELVWTGRPVTVTFPDGTSVQGEALDATGDQLYAIVRLAADAPAEAVALAPGAPGLGAPVAVLARARATVDQQTLSMGRVVSAGEAVFHIDAAVGDASLGAPVADPEGRLLGVVVGRADGFSAVVPSPVFADLKVAELDPEGGDWVTTMASGGMMGVSTDRTMTTGLYSGFRLVGWDQLQLDARIGILFDDDLPADDTTHLDREKVGAFVDLLAGYRFNLMPADLGPLQLTLSAGGTLQQFGGSLRHIGQGGRIVKTDIEESWVRPAVQVGLRMLDVIEFNYTMDINPDDIGASSHRIGFGIGF